MPHKIHRNHLIIVVLIAALFRSGFLLWSWSDSPYLMPQSVLSANYFREGYAIAAGYGYVIAVSAKGHAVLGELYRRVTVKNSYAPTVPLALIEEGHLQPKVLHPPGLPLIIAAAHVFFGTPADVQVQILGLGLDTASAGIFYWIVASFFGPMAGLMGALLYALFPPLAYYSVSRESDGLLGFFIIASLACTLKATSESGRKRYLWIVMAGVCIGVGSYVRPDYLLMPFGMFFGMWAYTRRLWRSVFTMAAIQAMALLLLLPWALRNHAVCDRWIFTSTSVGGTLVTGLGQFHNPWGFRALDEDRDKDAKAQGIDSAWSCEGDLYFRSVFFKSINEHPFGYAMTVIRRVPMVLATPYDFGFQNPKKTITFSQARVSGEDHYQVLLRRPGYVLAAYWEYLLMAGITFVCLLATVVLVWSERSKWGVMLLLLSPHLYSIGSHMLTYLEPRFLLPSMFASLIGPAYVINKVLSDRIFPIYATRRGKASQDASLYGRVGKI